MKYLKESQFVKNIATGNLRFKDRYIPDRKALQALVKMLKNAGYRIVLTQGVYDLFHVGHKRYLESAKNHGDILIIGVDTDELTRMRKGPNRPFDTLMDRLEILTSLRAVDIVTVRDHKEHIDALAQAIQPDVFVMSDTTGDFSKKSRLNLMNYCGMVKVLPAQASTSTTAKLRKMMIGGAEKLGKKITNLINDFLKGVNNENSSSIHTSNTRRTSKFLRKTKTRQTLRTRKKSHK